MADTNEIEIRDKQEVDADAGEPTLAGRFYTPSTDIYSTDDAITVVADMPGVSKESLEIDLREGVLTLTGKVEEVPEDYRLLQREYQIGGYLRKFNISDRIDSTGINAVLKDGVLTVELPKAEEAKPRKITVQVG